MSRMKETTEAVEAILSVIDMIFEKIGEKAEMEDGLEIIKELATNQEFKNKMQKAWDGRDRIPAEIKDMGIVDSASMVMLLFSGIKKIATTEEKFEGYPEGHKLLKNVTPEDKKPKPKPKPKPKK